MAEGHKGGREYLQPPEKAICPAAVDTAENPVDGQHNQESEAEA
jgi:hypothetical protein